MILLSNPVNSLVKPFLGISLLGVGICLSCSNTTERIIRYAIKVLLLVGVKELGLWYFLTGPRTEPAHTKPITMEKNYERR